jgi:CMP-2-keto-3-deoxyoctulosonic acid synthetase
MPNNQPQDAEQLIQQALQKAEQAAQEASQVAQQIGQVQEQVQRAVVDASRTAASQEVGAEREFEVGKDEAWFANIKRTYDEYQDSNLGRVSRLEGHIERLRSYQELALANAVENANAQSKQMLRHSEIAIENQWESVEEVSMASLAVSLARELVRSGSVE